MPAADIVIRGAREHNLRSLDLVIPRNQLVVLTGVSGSGKSSLAFDTLYAEGQRRYVESLSTYARQFLGQLPKPDVDSITGLAPSISIQQKVTSRNPRSTVGTITEVYDYLRVLYARVGQGFCVQCQQPIQAQSVDQIVESISALPEGTRYQLLAPIVQQQKGEFRDLFSDLLKQGYLRARVDGEVVNLSDDLGLKKHFKHTIEVVIDRLVSGKGNRLRLTEAVESAMRLSGGKLIVAPAAAQGNAAEEQLYSARYACPSCGISYEPPTPQLFSFNSPLGMCEACTGLGHRHEFRIERLVEDDSLSLSQGAMVLLGRFRKLGRWRRHIYEGVARVIEQDTNLAEGAFLRTPWRDLPPAARDLFWHGIPNRHITFTWRHRGGLWKHGGTWEGFLPELLDEYRTTRNPMRRRQLEKYMDVMTCSECQGARLNAQARNVRIVSASRLGHLKQRTRKGGGVRGKGLSLTEVCALSIEDAACFFEQLVLDETARLIAEDAIREIQGRLRFLIKCGLGYLSLDRTAPTLSGGESQRIRLAGQIGCGLVGVVYVLDEPSIGLHPRDNGMLLESLLELRDQGNTVLVVEHDEETMRAADHIIDFGPGPGVRGGELVGEGTVADIQSNPRSVTGAYLSGRETISVPPRRRPPGKNRIKIVGARHHNLQGIDVEIPLGLFVCVTGVSGSGKSSLCNDILWEVLNKEVNSGKGNPGRHTRVNGLHWLDKAIDIDQSPIGRTPRSNPATYVKLLDEIRKLYTQLPQAKVRGYKPGRFSFNVPEGRCEACEGHGATKLEMDFLADLWIPCNVCQGKRFNQETLEIKYRDKSIADVLEMDVQEALKHFQNHPKIHRLLRTLHDVGLDYLKLGQPSPTLSGGEAQRIKLARELGKRSTGKTFYLLDEPTTGLHFADVRKLLDVLHGFVESGNTVLVIEHHLDVIKTADWIIDLGPEGGDGGGRVIACGPPEEIARCRDSYTGQALQSVLKRSKSRPVSSRSRRAMSETDGRPATEVRDVITIRGASQHNLQSIDLTVPRDSMSVFCGPSGSGKTSLAMDTLYAEGQRRYVESLSAYARQFLGQMPKPKLEHISGLSPAIAIEQKTVGTTPRSTVGTVTEIYDYLRILFARLGRAYCPDCDVPVTRQTTDEIVERVLSLPSGTRLYLAAPVEMAVGQSYAKLWDKLGTQGYLRVRINGQTYLLEDVPEIDHRREHQVEAIVDRIQVRPESRGRIADSIETALELGQGVLHVIHVDREAPEPKWRVDRMSLHYSCPRCPSDSDREFVQLSPQNFSFNSPLGWCEACEGLGVEQGTDQQVLIASESLSLSEGAVSIWPSPRENPLFRQLLESLASAFEIPLDVPWYRLTPKHQRLILYGSDRWIPWREESGRTWATFQYKGLYPAIEEASRVSYEHRMKFLDVLGERPCTWCAGDRIRDDAAAVRLQEMTLPRLCRIPLSEALEWLTSLPLTEQERSFAGDLLNEVIHRLTFLVDVGLHYLTLDRGMPSLSGGESQRIRLAGQIGRALTGVLYVLDEPTIGLHPRDNKRLIDALHRLRDLGNTVVLVEHDQEILKSADRLYDFGPGSGRFGGIVTAEGTPQQIEQANGDSLTGDYLSGRKGIPIPPRRRISSGDDPQADDFRKRYSEPPGGAWLEITGCRQNNLRGVDLRIPLGTLTCITGLSGSGKSSLIQETLARAVARHLNRKGPSPGPFDQLLGVEAISRVIDVDQSPLGATPASNPATYTGLFDHIRNLFSKLPDARLRGYKPGRFSFNRAGGRCEECEGLGQRRIEMHFLPDVWVTCETCRGKRYNAETLAVRYRGYSISDVLEMSVEQALELFEKIPKIRAPLATLKAIGLGYLTLGQSATTLSGGEAQRVKLAAELCKPNSGRTLYLLDEPTTGLHFDDIAKLLQVLGSLVEQGNTVIVIEHNLDVIKTADWIVDLGPEAGLEGGRIVAQGTPEDVVRHARQNQNPEHRSWTGELLAPILDDQTRGDIGLFDAAAAARKREGDVEISQVGREAPLPWKINGRAWHTLNRPARNGKSCQWEGAALERVVDFIEQFWGLKEANWNDPSTVEITAEQKTGTGWFFHALSGDEWFVRFYFRVPKGSFDEEEIADSLNLTPVDEIDEIPVYGRGERVKFNNRKGPFQEISIDVHTLEEIDRPEFWDFVETAIACYLEKVHRTEQSSLAEVMPWKVLGRKWHLSRKGFPSNKRVAWKAEVLETLLERLDTSLSGTSVNWTTKTKIAYGLQDGAPLVEVQTKRRDAIHLTIYVARGSVALGQIADVGSSPEILPHTDGRDAVRLQLRSRKDVCHPALHELLRAELAKQRSRSA